MEISSKRKNIFLLESPFQILCANELVHSMNFENNLFIIKPSPVKENNRQTKVLIKYLPHINKKIHLPNLNSIFISDVILLFFLRILKLRKINYLVIGESASQMSLSFVDNMRYSYCLALDDGFSTVNLQKQIESGANLYEITKETSARRKMFKVIMKLLFLKRKPIYSIDWFTCFDITPIKGQMVYFNRFNIVRSLIKKKAETVEGVVYYLGGPYAEVGILSFESEIKYIKTFNNYLLSINKTMIYCVHRRETKLKREAIAEIIGEDKIRFAQFPIEIDFLFASENPGELASISSTALVTLNKIYNIRKTYVIDIAKNDLLKEKNDTINIYLMNNLANLIIFDKNKYSEYSS